MVRRQPRVKLNHRGCTTIETLAALAIAFLFAMPTFGQAQNALPLSKGQKSHRAHCSKFYCTPTWH